MDVKYKSPAVKVIQVVSPALICASNDGLQYGGSNEAGRTINNDEIDDYGEL